MGLMSGKAFLVWQHTFGLKSFGFDPCEFGVTIQTHDWYDWRIATKGLAGYIVKTWPLRRTA